MRKQSGFESWPLTVTPEHFSTLFPKDKIVYLTAESDQVLESVEPGCCYCIGGIVDHNRMKSLVHDHAVQAGFQTRRLPLEGYLAEGLRSVITVNQVFQIMLEYWATGDWKLAVPRVLPARWKADGEAVSVAQPSIRNETKAEAEAEVKAEVEENVGEEERLEGE